MASQSERTYGQRLEQGRQLFIVIEQFAKYEPSNNIIEKNTFYEFLELVEEANSRIAKLSAELKDSRNKRIDMYKGKNGLKELVFMIKYFVGTLPNGKDSSAYLQIKSEAKKFYSERQRRTEIDPLDAAGNEQPKRISKSESSYGSLIVAGRNILEVVKTINGYSPPNALISLDSFTAFLNQLEAVNNEVYTRVAISNIAVNKRKELYNGEVGLRHRVKIVKELVRSIYGRNSNEYNMISAIKY